MDINELQAEIDNEEIIELMTHSKALLNGHFQLRSGLHSDCFFQGALLLQYPDLAQKTCHQMAKFFTGQQVDCVISPAVGGLIVGHELARALGVRAIFADKENDELILKRGFSIKPGEKVVVAEDVITRGGRVQQTIDLARSHGADVVGVGVIVDRSGGLAKFDVSHYSLLKLKLETYEPDACPLCKQGIALDRPGSK